MTGQPPEHGSMERFSSPPVISPTQKVSTSPSASAIIAFVLGILAFITCGPCTGIPALIIGLIELRNIRNNASSPEGKPFALVGAILGGVNFALMIFAILFYIVMILFFLSIPGMMD